MHHSSRRRSTLDLRGHKADGKVGHNGSGLGDSGFAYVGSFQQTTEEVINFIVAQVARLLLHSL